jgi:peptide/nickel transport system permease protein
VTAYLIKRLLATIPVIVVTSIVVFTAMRVLPGDPIVVLVGQSQSEVSPETMDRLRREYSLDQPIYVQYLAWAGKLLAGDFGRSVRSRQPVLELLLPRLLPTLQIGLMAWLIALTLALPVGVISAIRPNSWADWLGTAGALAGAAMPYFLLGGVLIYVVALQLRWLPASGYVSPFVDPVQSVRSCLMPALTLSLSLAAVTSRQTRSSLSEVLLQPYITAARARGLGEWQVIVGHAFKNGMLPVATILGIYIGNVFGGAVVTETIFAVPGTGRLLVEAIFSRDYAVVQAVVLLISTSVVFANLVVDLVYCFLDPRIRLSQAS